MNNKNIYVEIHAIQTLPPSCVNRDDTGRPKTAVYGGAVRARVSSQSWKHAMREMFKEMNTDGNLGYRTKYAASLIASELKNLDNALSDEEADKAAADILDKTKIKIKDKKTNTTGALFFISKVQTEKLAELWISGEKDEKKYKDVLKDNSSVDIALFGRMVADDANLNVDAASQIAHSISTHAVQNEYDYFTAVDDCSEADNAGAGHLGTMEFNSSTLYRYAVLNVADLAKNYNFDIAQAVKDFTKAFIYSMPTGKQNSYANRTVPSIVYVTIRNDMPVNLCGAFEKPVYSTDGYEEKSAKALFKHAEKVYSDFCGEPVLSFVVGEKSVLNAEKVNFKELLDKLYEYISKEVV